MTENDFHVAPAWLSENYLENVLQTYKKDESLKIKSLDIQPATAKGENYASVMTRVKVSFTLAGSKEPIHESYLVKTSHESDPQATEIMKGYQPYATEMLMYEKVLPALQDLLEEINDGDKIFAATVHVDYKQTAIIFEDLSVDKYFTADRVKGLDDKHILLALKKMAKMHATAAVFNERNQQFLTKFDRGIFNQHTKGFKYFFEGVIGVAGETAENIPELGSYYKEKLFKIKEKVMDYSAAAYEPKENFFNTLTHGDFWTNNLLVRYDDKKWLSRPTLVDMKLIDFQFCAWSSPAVDIYYFLHTSWQDEFRYHHYEEFIKQYYDTLTTTLRLLKFNGKIPTLKDFWLQLETNGFLAIPFALVCQALMINTDTTDADFNAMMQDDERARRFKRTLYKNDKIQKFLKRILPMFDQKGLLDVDD